MTELTELYVYAYAWVYMKNKNDSYLCVEWSAMSQWKSERVRTMAKKISRSEWEGEIERECVWTSENDG